MISFIYSHIYTPSRRTLRITTWEAKDGVIEESLDKAIYTTNTPLSDKNEDNERGVFNPLMDRDTDFLISI